MKALGYLKYTLARHTRNPNRRNARLPHKTSFMNMEGFVLLLSVIYSWTTGIEISSRQNCVFNSYQTHKRRSTGRPFNVFSSTSSILLAIPGIGGTLELESISESMRGEYYWSHIAAGVYRNVTECSKCIQCKWFKKRWCILQYFHVSDQLVFIAMNMLGPLWKKVRDRNMILVITSLYTKLANAVLTSTTITSYIALPFMDHWEISYEIR